MTQPAQQLFEYLLAVKNMTSPPKREIRLYEEYWYLDELPIGPGIVVDRDQLDPDVFIAVHKQVIPEPPEPNDILKLWMVGLPKTSIEELAVKESIKQDDDDSVTHEIRFEDDDDRVEALQIYRHSWMKWYEATKLPREVQSFYSSLFTFWQRLDREGNALEVSVGQGSLLWNTAQGKIDRPLLVTRLSMEFDAERGVFQFRLSDRGTRLETEMLAGIDIPNAKLIEDMKRSVREEGFDLFNNEQTSHLYEEFVTLLDSNGDVRTADDPYRPKEFPLVFDRTVLFVRKAGEELWKTELSTAAELIEANRLDLPETIQSLFQDEAILQSSATEKKWEAVGADLFFPLDANEDQREIAKRLSKNFGLTVQGPPGTGKSHTIANLISHLLAHGKRVLVTSQTEKALKVLKDKIPDEIKPLCVSVLGGDSKSVQEIKTSVDAISDKLASENPSHLAREVEDLRESLYQSKKRIEELHDQLKSAAIKASQTVQWRGQEIKPIDAAMLVAESGIDTSWIQDTPKPSDNFPLSSEEVEETLRLKAMLSKQEYSRYQLLLPPIATLPSPNEFRALVQEFNALNLVATNTKHLVDDLKVLPAEDSLQVLHDAIEQVLGFRDVLDGKYQRILLDDFLIGGDRKANWLELHDHTNKIANEITTLQRFLTEHELNLPSDHPYDKLRTDMTTLQETYQNGGPGLIFKLGKGRSLKYLTEFPAIDGRRLGSLEDVNKLITHLEVIDKKGRLMRRWNAIMNEVDGPTLSVDEKRFAIRALDLAAEIDRVQIAEKSIQHLRKLLAQSNMPPAETVTPSYCEQLICQIDAAHNLHQLERASLAIRKVQEMFAPGQTENHHPIWNRFEEATSSLDINLWETLYDDCKGIAQTNANAHSFAKLLDKLKVTAPMLAQQWEESLGELTYLSDQYREAWALKQLDVWLDEVAKTDPEWIERAIREEEARSRRLIEQIVSRATWKAQLARVTEAQRKSLSAWKQLIGKIGKGTGKYADRHRLEARNEMEKCQGSIPVWIMPINRVIESFALGNDKFDVVIIDESSQCDLYSLSVLLRAEKAVIVGDNEQISPSAVGTDMGELMRLMEKTLKNVPRRSLYDMKTSLYDLGEQIFPQGARLMLKEHFRCVPEIIQFSNDLSYEGKIVPLRLPETGEKIDPPVVAIRVPGFRDENRKLNEVEARQIVQDIKDMLQDSRFDNQTFGVVSLLGNDQVKFLENLIRQEIGEEIMEKRRILCGDAYAFQGDERDIMFLSMVVARNEGYAALTSKDYQRRFNVAASRAKNQMRLYHSVDLDDLKPDDMRYRLLSYCLEPKRMLQPDENIEKLCDSPFEIEVLRMIQARGYRVVPQFKVGGYRIDLVIEGVRKRLAIECDGEAYHDMSRWEYDKERQRVLERVGWTFWRVRGFDFYRNRETAMESLWETLEQMGIEKSESEKLLIS